MTLTAVPSRATACGSVRSHAITPRRLIEAHGRHDPSVGRVAHQSRKVFVVISHLSASGSSPVRSLLLVLGLVTGEAVESVPAAHPFKRSRISA